MNSEENWCVRREAQLHGEIGFTDGRIAREGQSSSRGLSSPPPLGAVRP